MAEFHGKPAQNVAPASDLAMILLQLAASQAEIGPFARRRRETPQEAARLYREAAQRR
jgi:hypothetical protein